MYLKGLKTNKKTQIVDNLNQTIYPLTPTSDQDRISPYNIITISNRQVMRIKENIGEGTIKNWFNTKFSKQTSQEL